MNIMILDDHELFSISLQFLLKEEITQFSSFTRINKLLEALQEKLPDILLLDINLQETNGIDVGKIILSLYPEIKIIYLSGYDLDEYYNQAIKMGAKGFLNKDISPSELIKNLRLVYQGEILFNDSTDRKISLTDREKEILQQTALGKSQKMIAAELFIGVSTVGNHVNEILWKLEVDNMKAAIVRGIELGIVSINI